MHNSAWLNFLILADNVTPSVSKLNTLFDCMKSLSKLGSPTVPFTSQREDEFDANVTSCIFSPSGQHKNSEGEKQRIQKFWLFAASDIMLPEAIALVGRFPGARKISTQFVESRAVRLDPEVCPSFPLHPTFSHPSNRSLSLGSSSSMPSGIAFPMGTTTSSPQKSSPGSAAPQTCP